MKNKDLIVNAGNISSQREEELFHSLVDSIKDYALFMLDKEGRVITWNKGAGIIKGYKENEIKGHHFSVFYTHEDRDRNKPQLHLEVAAKHGRFETDGWRVRKNGTLFWANVIITALYDSEGKVKGFTKITRDITKKKTWDELISRQARLLEDTSDAIFSTNLLYEIRSWNRAAEKLYGYTAEETIGKPITGVVKLQLSIEERDAARADLQKQGYWKREFIHLNKEGTPLSLHIAASVTKNEHEEPDGYVFVCRDFSDRRRMEEQLRQFNEEALRISEYRYRTLFDEGVAGIFVLSRNDLHIIEANNTVSQMLGYSKEEFLGMHFHEILCEGPLKDKARKVSADNTSWSIHDESMVKRKNQGCLHIEAVSRVLPDGSHLVFIADIADRKRIEKEMLEINERFSLVSKATNDGVWDLDLGRMKLWWNDSHYKMIGMDPAVFQPSREEWEKRIHPDDREEAVRKFDEALKNGEKFLSDKFRVLRGDGTYGIYYDRSYVIYDANNKPLRIIGTMTDITELTRTEEQLRISEKKYKLLFQSNPMPMWMLSIADGKMIDVNESALRHYGYDREEFLAMSPQSMRPAEEIKRYDRELRTEIKNVPERGTWRHRKKDGSVIFVEIHAYDVLYEGRQVRLVLSHDITQKLRAEEELVKSLEEVKRLASYLQDVREEEKKNIAREIHDELGQMLTGLKMDIVWLRKKIASEEELIQDRFERTLSLLSQTKQTIRRISTDLHPATLKDLGLVAALEAQSRDFESRSGIRVQFVADIMDGIDMSFSPAVSIGLYRVFQESLNNIAKHAHARNVNSFLEINGNRIVLRVSDDGTGFNVSEVAGKKTLGLVGIRERAQMLNGECSINSLPNEGTTIMLSVPLT